ncbi:IS66 family transposase [Salmonella enterica]|nr:IS66 family transposase [Salmonella enterica]EBZ8404225.1 IS66 family transposase [Salmonella enterica subsp. enterica serovar Muenchen]ECC6922449.1 IS66 family transposase [Salmonella enterica]ECM3183751.1 IS66 family transposase [Salmonella enterica subsp. enterica serovar Newport]
MKTELPDDIEQLKAMLRQQQARLRQYAGQVAGYEQEIERLKAQLDKLRRMLFGQSSEKKRHKLENQIRQAEKRLSELENRLSTARGYLEDAAAVTESPETSPPPEQSVVDTPAVASHKSSRKPLPAELPRETHRLLPAETACPACGGELKVMGETISEQLEIINTAFKVIETVRPKLACSRCDVIVQAPLPPKPIERSYTSPGLLARILVSKYGEHIPLYRQSEIYARQGVELSRKTMMRWVSEMADRLSPLYIALNSYVLEAGKVHTDDTPVKVLAPGSGKTKTGRLWVYVRDDRNAGSSLPAAVWFAYSADRKGEHPQQHLAEYQGVLQADAYSAYDALYETGRVKEAACLAHARRKIHDEDARRPTEMTQEALRRIAELYAIEAEIRGSPADERLAVRKARSVPLMQSFYDWIQLQRKTLSKHAEMAKAFDYILKQWDALNEFCRDGWVEIDNNIGENALRSVAVGRKNYLFFGSDNGGESAAIIYILLVTCKLNNVEPEDWLREVIMKINDWPSNRVHELLPWNFSPVK